MFKSRHIINVSTDSVEESKKGEEEDAEKHVRGSVGGGGLHLVS